MEIDRRGDPLEMRDCHSENVQIPTQAARANAMATLLLKRPAQGIQLWLAQRAWSRSPFSRVIS
jgi:hypothetical protein